MLILKRDNLSCSQQELIRTSCQILLDYVNMWACQCQRFMKRMPNEEECEATETSFAKAREE